MPTPLIPVSSGTTFTLKDVCNAIYVDCIVGNDSTYNGKSLSGCTIDAIDANFDINYKGTKSNLYNFRNYGDNIIFTFSIPNFINKVIPQTGNTAEYAYTNFNVEITNATKICDNTTCGFDMSLNSDMSNAISYGASQNYTINTTPTTIGVLMEQSYFNTIYYIRPFVYYNSIKYIDTTIYNTTTVTNTKTSFGIVLKRSSFSPSDPYSCYISSKKLGFPNTIGSNNVLHNITGTVEYFTVSNPDLYYVYPVINIDTSQSESFYITNNMEIHLRSIIPTEPDTSTFYTTNFTYTDNNGTQVTIVNDIGL